MTGSVFTEEMLFLDENQSPNLLMNRARVVTFRIFEVLSEVEKGKPVLARHNTVSWAGKSASVQDIVHNE